jgi:hypothetical protein
MCALPNKKASNAFAYKFARAPPKFLHKHIVHKCDKKYTMMHMTIYITTIK